VADGISVVLLACVLGAVAMHALGTVLRLLWRKRTVVVFGGDEDAAWHDVAAPVAVFAACVWVCAMSGLQVAPLVLFGGDDTGSRGIVAVAQVMFAVLRGAIALANIPV
jgi:hypothetical protein